MFTKKDSDFPVTEVMQEFKRRRIHQIKVTIPFLAIILMFVFLADKNDAAAMSIPMSLLIGMSFFSIFEIIGTIQRKLN